MTGSPILAVPATWWTNNPEGAWTAPNGDIISADVWGLKDNPAYTQLTWAISQSLWGATVKAPAVANPGVVAFPDAQRPYKHVNIAAAGIFPAAWAVSAPPADAGFTGDVMWDIWANGPGPGLGVEISVFLQMMGVSTAGNEQLGSGIEIGGNTWSASLRPGSDPQQLSFEPATPMPAGSMDLRPFFMWLIANGNLPAQTTIQAAELGAEIIGTAGKQMQVLCTEFQLPAA